MSSSPAPASTTATAPLASVEWLRFVASFGIVAFHLAVPGGRAGYAGLPVFMLLTAAMAVKSARRHPWRDYSRGRLRRLLLPWLVWSAVYAGLHAYRCSVLQQPLWSWGDWSMLLIGTWFHLWYLPFAAVLTMLVARFASRATSPWGWLVAGLLLLPICAWLAFAGLPEPLPQWRFVLPAAVLGIGLAQLPLGERRAVPSLVAIAAATLALCGALQAVGWLDLVQPYAIGIVATAVAWPIGAVAGRGTLFITRTSFGVYVLHPLFAGLAALWQYQAGFELGVWTQLGLVFGASVVATALLRATPMRAVL